MNNVTRKCSLASKTGQQRQTKYYTANAVLHEISSTSSTRHAAWHWSIIYLSCQVVCYLWWRHNSSQSRATSRIEQRFSGLSWCGPTTGQSSAANRFTIVCAEKIELIWVLHFVDRDLEPVAFVSTRKYICEFGMNNHASSEHCGCVLILDYYFLLKVWQGKRDHISCYHSTRQPRKLWNRIVSIWISS
jgi:hypothetical protein